MNSESLQIIKSEITFFMDKSFQFSFVYVGAVFAGIASIKLDVIDTWAIKLHTTAETLLTILILLLNLVYLILASSCIFAILKRGYFFLAHSDQQPEGPLVVWEKFVRKATGSFSTLGWNVDNYYVGVIWFFIFALSMCGFFYGILNATGTSVIVLSVLMALHGIPVWCLVQTAKLNRACRAKIAERARGSNHSGMQRSV